MPKSKRNKIVHLTQVKKKGKDHKEDLIKQLELYLAKFKRVFLLDLDSTKSDKILNLRLALKEHGNVFAGKNSVASLTIRNIGGKTKTNYNDLIENIVGHRGLFFTNLTSKQLITILDDKQPEFCKKLVGYAQLSQDKATQGDDKPTPGKNKNKKNTKALNTSGDLDENGNIKVKFIKV